MNFEREDGDQEPSEVISHLIIPFMDRMLCEDDWLGSHFLYQIGVRLLTDDDDDAFDQKVAFLSVNLF